MLENWRLMATMPIPDAWPAESQERVGLLLDKAYGETIKSILIGCAGLSLLAGLIALGYRKTDGRADD